MPKILCISLLFIILLFGGAEAQETQQNNTSLKANNLLLEYISTGEVNLQWSSNKEVLIIASPHPLRQAPNKKNYSHCTKFGSGAHVEEGFVVYKGKKNAIVVSELELGQYFYFTSFVANDKGIYNVPGPALTSFVVWSLGNKAEITIKATASSTNDQAIVERSSDGLYWETLTTLNLMKPENGTVTYNYIDKGPLVGDHIYRIKQGFSDNYVTSVPLSIQSFSFSNVYELWNSEQDPNNWFVVSDVNTQINVTNALGEIVKKVELKDQNDFAYLICDLPNGIYNICGLNTNGKLNSKITVNR